MTYSWKFTPLLFAVVSAPAFASLIGTDWTSTGSSHLYNIDTAARTATLIGSTGQPAMIGLVVDTTSTIYTISEETNSGLWTLNATTGAATLVGRLGLNFQEGDMTIDPTSGTIYAANGSGDHLYTINKTTGAATLVGSFGASGRDISGMQFFNGTLYGLSLNDSAPDTLVSINPTTGLATTIGTTGTNFGVIAAMGRDPSDGNIYIAGPTTSFGSDNTIWTLNLATGTATLKGNLTGVLASISGFSVAGNPVILTGTPEPATMSLVGLAFVGLFALKARKLRD